MSVSFTIPIILEAHGKESPALSSDISYDPTLLGNPKVVIGIVGLNQNAIPDGVGAYMIFDVLKSGQIWLRNKPTASDSHGNMVSVIIKDSKINAQN